MKLTVLLAPVLLGTAASAAGTVSFELTRQPAQISYDGLHRRGLHGRAKATEVFLQTNKARFIANVSLGDPPQMLPLSIDTGSSDIWVNSVDNTACGEIQTCLGTYDFSASKSAKHIDKNDLNGNDTFNVRYSTGDIGANGSYIKDKMSWGGLEVKQQIMGLANISNINMGILGLSFNTSVGTIARRKPVAYPTFLDNLVAQGTINKRLFSLFLNTTDSPTSSLVFGGVDTERYYDDLVEVPMVPTFIKNMVSQYAVMLEGFSPKGIDGAKELKESKLVILDNGSPLNILPADIVAPLEKFFDTVAIKTQYISGTYVNCAAGRNHEGINFAFKFAGKTIYMPVSDAVADVFTDKDKRTLKTALGDKAKDWTGVCALSFLPEVPGVPFLLGDPFLRNAYVVYDQDRETIALAQAKLNSAKTNIVEIAKDTGVPTKKGEATPKYIIDGTTASSNGDKGGDKGGNDKGSSNGGGGDGKDDKGKDGKNGKDNSGSGLQASMAFVLMAGIITVLF